MTRRVSIATADGTWTLDLDAQARSAAVVSFAPGAGAAPDPGLIERAASWLRAEASLALEGPLAAEAVDARLSQCRSCPHLEPLPAPQVGWCQACGCPRSGRAELTVKATMPAASCPRGRWG